MSPDEILRRDVARYVVSLLVVLEPVDATSASNRMKWHLKREPGRVVDWAARLMSGAMETLPSEDPWRTLVTIHDDPHARRRQRVTPTYPSGTYTRERLPFGTSPWLDGADLAYVAQGEDPHVEPDLAPIASGLTPEAAALVAMASEPYVRVAAHLGLVTERYERDRRFPFERLWSDIDRTLRRLVFRRGQYLTGTDRWLHGFATGWCFDPRSSRDAAVDPGRIHDGAWRAHVDARWASQAEPEGF